MKISYFVLQVETV